MQKILYVKITACCMLLIAFCGRLHPVKSRSPDSEFTVRHNKYCKKSKFVFVLNKLGTTP
jgi:hypothetical protein